MRGTKPVLLKTIADDAVKLAAKAGQVGEGVRGRGGEEATRVCVCVCWESGAQGRPGSDGRAGGCGQHRVGCDSDSGVCTRTGQLAWSGVDEQQANAKD